MARTDKMNRLRTKFELRTIFSLPTDTGASLPSYCQVDEHSRQLAYADCQDQRSCRELLSALFSAGQSWLEFRKCWLERQNAGTEGKETLIRIFPDKGVFLLQESGRTLAGNSRGSGCGIGRASLFCVPGLEEAWNCGLRFACWFCRTQIR